MKFLSKIFPKGKKPASYLRPPGAIKELFFSGQCTRCGKCIDNCTYNAIKPAKGDEYKNIGRKTPIILPEETPCFLCMECTLVCPTGALRKINKADVLLGKAIVDAPQCASWGKGSCDKCIKACPVDNKAVEIRDGVAYIIKDSCNGCGMCAKACIAHPKAIKIIPSFCLE